MIGKKPLLLSFICLFILAGVCKAQDDDEYLRLKKRPGPFGGGPITVEATCNGTGSAITIPCSGAMTVTAGDTIVCEGSGNDFDPESLAFADSVNGFYDGIEGLAHPNASTTSWVAAAAFQNSAGGSITPQVFNYESVTLNIKCRALKGTRTSKVLDGGAVNQTKSQSVAAANPTSGAAAAPTNNNEFVDGWMVRPTTATVTDSAPWVPGGTITAIGSSFPLYDQYQIQTTATAVNSPMTASSAQFTDSQFAVLNSANPAGFRGFTGFYGAPAIAKTNGNTATAADLNGVTTTLADINASTTWTLTGTAATYDTSVLPSGTGSLLVQGTTHGFGDAATSVLFSGATTATSYEWDAQIENFGTPEYYSMFFRVGSSGITSGQSCDGPRLAGAITESGLLAQIQYSTTNGVGVFFETFEGGQSPQLNFGSLDTDYWIQIHAAGVNERNHQFLAYSKSGGVWSLIGTLNYDVLCATQAIIGCTTPTTVGSGTGSASSGSTSLTITSGTGTISTGQIVYPTTGIPYITMVAGVSGTCSSSCTVTLSQNTTASVSGTVNFVTAPTTFALASNASSSASAGATSVSVAAPGTGTITAGQPIGGTGMPSGETVASVSGTGPFTVTLSMPTNAAISVGSGLSFWNATSNFTGVTFGKWSSCSIASSEWYSGQLFDPYGEWGAFAPN